MRPRDAGASFLDDRPSVRARNPQTGRVHLRMADEQAVPGTDMDVAEDEAGDAALGQADHDTGAVGAGGGEPLDPNIADPGRGVRRIGTRRVRLVRIDLMATTASPTSNKLLLISMSRVSIGSIASVFGEWASAMKRMWFTVTLRESFTTKWKLGEL